MDKAEWVKGVVEHDAGDDTMYLSIPFTWNLPEAYQRAVWFKQLGKHVVAGGPAVNLMPDFLEDVATIGTDWPDAVRHHNPQATFTSRGCIRKCSFCVVWRTEGWLQELDEWPVRPIICDNNLLACSQPHFDDVIDKLKPLPWCDFQGIDARLLKKHHAERMAELKRPLLHMALDNSKTEKQFLKGHKLLTDEGIPAKLIRVYVLFGYNDTPEDALYRLRLVQSLGSWPNPQRYHPLDAMTRNGYVDPNWT